jgi:Flp pilus assembly protein protease CpaA
MQIIGAIIFLIILLWFLQAVVGGGHFPKLLTVIGALTHA